MEGVFAGAFYNYFNQSLNKWNTSKVENMRDMFKNNKTFDQNIRIWTVKQDADLNNMFENATEMISRYGPSGENITSFRTNDDNYTPSYLFFNYSEYIPDKPNHASIYIAILEWMTDKESAIGKYGEMKSWDTQYVTNMKGLFNWNNTEKYQYDGNNNYDTDVVIKTNFNNFNEDISNWDTSNVTNMDNMFYYCKNFNIDIGNWNTGKVNNMRSMFSDTIKFDKNVNTKEVTVNGNTYYAWDVSNVTDMAYIFYGTFVYNQPLNNWMYLML